MKNLSGNALRQCFLDYFTSVGHTPVKSASLIPYDDPTLLFTNAGMVQFKEVFLGLDQRPYKLAVTSQRCLRAGGKHNDLDTVGRTARHHTFFEMMGNFSFGAYFKREAINYAWEFLTKVLEMPVNRLYATVYEQDDEAAMLWQEITGLPKERIFRIGEKDNFWSMGDTGPCGPCSEIFYDRGEEYSCDAPQCAIGSCDCDRWMEIWNLVFMQYDRDEKGILTPLPKPSIDTGLGLERVASILQGAKSNYDTDLLHGLIKGVEELSGLTYDPGTAGFPFRVIADHARACSFLIADGITPSNEGRGYVLRRILRRAARLGRRLGLNEPFLYRVFPYVQASLADAYPELTEQAAHIEKVIRGEEERFNTTLTEGLRYAQGIIEKTLTKKAAQLSGDDLFLLYDTYGFPLDLAKDIAEEHGLGIDEADFEKAMAKQRQRARSAREEASPADNAAQLSLLLSDITASTFIGYDTLCAKEKILALLFAGMRQDNLSQGQNGYIVLSRSPFYAESGGQVGDSGLIYAPSGLAKVLDTQKLPNGQIILKVFIEQGIVYEGAEVQAQVDKAKRAAISRNHSATHLLQQALRHHLGDDAHQAGSLVTQERLRFDFSAHTPLSAKELNDIEQEVNEQVLNNLLISTQEMNIDEAKAAKALAFFGDKYGERVRVVRMGDYSIELCGGAHCCFTAEIGSFKIISEGGIGSGLRRIEAVTGYAALNYYSAQEQQLGRLAALLKTIPQDAERRLESLLIEYKTLQKEIEAAHSSKTREKLTDILAAAQEQGGIKTLVAMVAAHNMDSLRQTLDLLRDNLPDAAIVLAATTEDKVQFVASMSKKAVSAGLHAGKIIKQVAAICGGSGGGRPDMAQAGGKDNRPEKVAEALDIAKVLISRQEKQ